MDIKNIYNAGIILSNNFSTLCMPYKYNFENKTQTISLELAMAISSRLCENTPEGLNNKITLYGGDDTNIWRDLVVPTVQCINSFNRSIIEIQTENNFLNEIQLKFCKDSNVLLSNIITTNINLDYLYTVFSYKPLTNIVYVLTLNTINNLYEQYLKLEELNCQNLDFRLDTFANWTEDSQTILNEQISKIISHIYDKFNDDDLPLVPESFKKMINKIIVKDYNIKNNACAFDYLELLNHQCGFSKKTPYVIDTQGLVYTCCLCSFKEDDALNCGKFNLEFNNFEATQDEFDIFNKIYPDILNITKISTDYSCTDCILDDICTGDCYSINMYINKNGNISSKIFCDYNINLYQQLLALMLHLDEDKNELFRDFLFGCSLKGYFIYDR